MKMGKLLARLPVARGVLFIEPHGFLVSYQQQSQAKHERFNFFNCLAPANTKNR
jgi:hypothetical protein